MQAEIVSRLPAGAALYPPDQETEATERFLVGELIRERVLHHAKEEVPHAVAVEVEEFDESGGRALVSIRAVIYVERDSQKAIIIGKQGRMLKTLGAEARAEIEALLGAHVFWTSGSRSGRTGARTPGPCAPWATRIGQGSGDR